MQPRPAEKARATAGAAMARNQGHQTRVYRHPGRTSRQKLLERAGDCLFALQFGADEAQRQFLWSLFVLRLQRAYAERR
jgi:hypothetical protein